MARELKTLEFNPNPYVTPSSTLVYSGYEPFRSQNEMALGVDEFSEPKTTNYPPSATLSKTLGSRL